MNTNLKLACIALAAAGLMVVTTSAQANSWVHTTNPGPHAAQVTGSPGSRAKDLYDVRFVGINGQNIPSRETLWLHPGRYSLTVQIIAVGTRSSLMRRTREERGYNTIEVVVEAGKTYDIRAKFDRQNQRAPYSVILHRVVE